MFRSCVAVFISGIFLMGQAQAFQRTPDASALLKAATAAIGADNLKTVEFAGNGWDATLFVQDPSGEPKALEIPIS